jgi:predicted dinucleotide-binding enzyme
LVAGFHTVGAHALADLEGPVQGDVLLCGADPEAKAEVGRLAELIPHLRWVDVGPLSSARLIEPLTAVLVQINRGYGTKAAGVAVTGRDAWGAPPQR